MFDYDRALSAHLKSPQPAPKPTRRQPHSEREKMGVHLGIVHHWNDTANFGFLRPDAQIVEGIDRDLFVGRRC